MRCKVLVVVGAILAGLASPLMAKTPLDKITIAGPGLRAPLEITDEPTLRLSNPWFGRFVEWAAPPVKAPANARVYTVTLYARHRSSDVRPIYQFQYVPGPDGQRGLAYLPGKGEPSYSQNVSIIIRDGRDGHWLVAGAEWESRIKSALFASRRTSQTDARR